MHLFRLPHRRGFLPDALFRGSFLDQFQAERQIRIRSSGHKREVAAAEIRASKISFVQPGRKETAFRLLRRGRAGVARAAEPLTVSHTSHGEERRIRMVMRGLGCSQSWDSVAPALLSMNRRRCEFSK